MGNLFEANGNPQQATKPKKDIRMYMSRLHAKRFSTLRNRIVEEKASGSNEWIVA